MPHRNRIRTGDQALVREINLSVIMNQLRAHAPISRAALAELTGLNKTTVSSLVEELIDHQLVHEAGINTSGLGRPSVLLTFNPDAGIIIGSEIGVDFISVIMTDFLGAIKWERRETHPPHMTQREILDRTVEIMRDAIAAGASISNHLLGIAIGVPGLVDQTTGTLLFAPNLEWENVPLSSILRAHFAAPIYVDNEANLATLAEHYFGAADKHSEILYISVGVGLGGGIIRGGQLFKGSAGFAGEFGHMTVVPNGLPCNCGNRGCWETVVSQAAVFRSIQQAVANGRRTLLLDIIGGDLEKLSIPAVVEAAHAGDPLALEVLGEVGHHLGVGIASLVNALNPQLVVFGGILSLAGDFLLPIINQELAQRALPWNRMTTEVVLAHYGLNATPMGAVATVLQDVLARPGSMVPQR